MRKLLLILGACFLFVPPAEAQNSTIVTATITDPNGLPYSSATVQAQLIPAGVTPRIPPPCNGQSASPCFVSGFTSATADVTGSFSMNLASNAVLLPGGTQWQFTVSETGIAPPAGTGPQSFTTAITISGASQSISATLSALAPRLSNVSGGGGGPFSAITSGTNTAALIEGSGGSITPSGTGTITATSAIGYQGKVFNFADPAYGGAASNTAGQNNTALAALCTAVNAYAGTSLQERPVVYIPGGSATANATYAYSAGCNFTRPIELVCGPGAILNYSGAGHAMDFGPSGVIATTVTQAQATSIYRVEDCGWTGGASMTEGLNFNQFVFGAYVIGNMFYQFGNNGANVFAVYMNPNISTAFVERNKVVNDDNTARNWARIDATSGFNDQAHFIDNYTVNTNFAVGGGTTYTMPVGINIWVDGVGSEVTDNDLNFCAPCVRVGPGLTGPTVNGTRVSNNYMEGVAGGPNVATPIIQYGDPGSATFVDSLHVMGNFIIPNSASNFIMGPSSATTGLVNAMFANNRLASSFTFPVIVLNNVASMTGNSWWDDIGCSGNSQCLPGQIINVSGSILPWGSPNYPLWLTDGTAALPSIARAAVTAQDIQPPGFDFATDPGNGRYAYFTSNVTGISTAFGVQNQNATGAFSGFFLNSAQDVGTFPSRGFTIRHNGGATGTSLAFWEKQPLNIFHAPVTAGTLVQTWEFPKTGHLISAGVALTSGNLSTCGTSPSIVGTDTAGTITVGTAAGTSCTLTFGVAYTTTPPTCTVSDASAIVAIQPTVTTSTLVLTGSAALTSAKIAYICIGSVVEP